MPHDNPAQGTLTGGCLCGAVRFTVTGAPTQFSVCHCDMCRRWAGGPLLAVNLTVPVAFEGADKISVYRSSKWAERGFCGVCGSNLFYRMIEDGTHVLSLGIFDDQSAFVMESEIFVDEKPPGYTFANDVPAITGAEVFAQYTGGGQHA